MTAPMPGGRRRIDRVLGEDFLLGITDADLDVLREKRADAEQEEVDLSYIRRLLQGRIDIVEAERERRSSGATASLVDRLAEILADDDPTTTGSGRYLTTQPSRVDEHRRTVEALVADVRISDASSLSDEQLDAAVRILRRNEQQVSDLRRQVQTVVDAISEEVGRRVAADA